MIATIERLAERLYRERRRLGVVSPLVFAAGYLLYARFSGPQVLGLSVPLFAALLYTAVIAGATLATALVLPRLRFTVEAMAIARLLFAGSSTLAAPGLLPDARSPTLQATLVIALAVIVVRLFFGAWSARRLTRPGFVTRTTRRSRASRDHLLRALGADEAARQGSAWATALRGLSGPDATLDRVIEGAADPGTVDRVETLADGTGRRVHYRADRGPAPLWREVRIEDLGHVRRVTMTVCHGPLPLSAIVTAWLDDSYGRLCDRLIAVSRAQGAPLPAPMVPAPATA